MATYEHTKTLKRATPTVDTESGIVKKWDIEVVYTATADGWKTTYSHEEDVEYLNKLPEEYTKSELVDMMPANLSGHIFHAHYEAHNVPPTTERVGDFNINSLQD